MGRRGLCGAASAEREPHLCGALRQMLRTARRSGIEVIQADVSRPLPLRSNLFDGAFSVSALQFLCHATDEESAESRRAAWRCKRHDVLRTRRTACASSVDTSTSEPTRRLACLIQLQLMPSFGVAGCAVPLTRSPA